MKQYSKLVRDLIPEIIQNSGKECKTRILTDAEYKEKLAQKLCEEANEFLESKDKEELADVLEVFLSLLEAYDFTIEEVDAIREVKAAQRGGFSKRIELLEVSD